MQMFDLHKNIYRLTRYACTQETKEKYVKERHKFLGDWELLKSRGVPDSETARITGISRATYYRRKKAISKSLGEFKRELQKAVTKYSTYRPHFSLNGLTPLGYTNQILAA